MIGIERLLLSGARVGLFVDVFEALGRDVSVYLGGGDVGMAEQHAARARRQAA